MKILFNFLFLASPLFAATDYEMFSAADYAVTVNDGQILVSTTPQKPNAPEPVGKVLVEGSIRQFSIVKNDPLKTNAEATILSSSYQDENGYVVNPARPPCKSDSLALYWLNGGVWEPVPNSVLDLQNKRVSSNVTLQDSMTIAIFGALEAPPVIAKTPLVSFVESPRGFKDVPVGASVFVFDASGKGVGMNASPFLGSLTAGSYYFVVLDPNGPDQKGVFEIK